jgi:hypothetical protein
MGSLKSVNLNIKIGWFGTQQYHEINSLRLSGSWI